ncbi:MAG: hypothetical protein KGZ82_02355 [Bacteroidales bacterium]|nr:hypothetical protein [Bacteroidales bacterium]
MNFKSLTIQIILTFLISLIVASVVTLLWNTFIARKVYEVDWQTAFVMAIVLGIVVPLTRRKK